MVTTSVKGIGLQGVGFSGATAKTGAGNGDVFQEVLNRQTDDEPVSAKNDRKSSMTADTDKVSRYQKSRDVSNHREDVEESDEDKALKALKSAEENQKQLLEKVAELFGVPVEQVREIVSQLNIPQDQVMSVEQLGSLVQEVSGAQESFALVTDAELYGKYQELTQLRGGLLEDAAKELGVEPEKLQELVQTTLENAPKMQGIDGQEPVAKEKYEAPELEATKDNNNVQAEDGAAQMPKVMPRQANESQNEEGHSERQEGHSQTGEGNLVLQQMLRDDSQIGQTRETTQVLTVSETDTQEIMKQILDYMKIQVKPDMSSLEMQLHPASLGTIQVQLASRAGGMTAQFFAQNEMVKAALETQMIQLQEQFEEQGIKVDAIEVSVQTNAFQQNLDEQGRGHQEQQTPAQRGTRRIRLDGSLTAQQLDELTKDEQIAVEMMEANGGTIDYTV